MKAARHDHHREQQRRPNGSQQTQGDEQPARRFAKPGGGRHHPAGAESERFEEVAGARDTVPAEPPEELLRPVCGHEDAKDQPRDE